MESTNAIAGSKALSDVSSKSVEDMENSLVIGEARSNVSSKDFEEKTGFSVVPGGSSVQGANDPDELNLEINSSKTNDETPPIVLDLLDGPSNGENLDESNLGVNSSNTGTGGIPDLVLDPLQDSAEGKNLDESTVEVPRIEPEASNVANADQEDEQYSCKYCHRKFTNKQSLGGHQNAHKFERALEKDASEAHESRAGYFNGSSSYSRITSPLSFLPGSLKRSYEFMNRPVQINRLYQSQKMLPRAIPRPFHGFYRGYRPGWMHVPRVSRSGMAPPSYLPSLALTLQFPNPGAPSSSYSSSSSSRPVPQGLPAFPESTTVPGRYARVLNNNQINVPGDEEDDSGLDLTLRL